MLLSEFDDVFEKASTTIMLLPAFLSEPENWHFGSDQLSLYYIGYDQNKQHVIFGILICFSENTFFLWINSST